MKIRDEVLPGIPLILGEGGSGIAQDPKSSGVPTEWDTTNNVAWRIDVPGLGWSSPIAWGNRVLLTTAVDTQGTEQPEEGFYLGKDRGGRGEHRWLVLACDLNTGAKLWERQVHQAVPNPVAGNGMVYVGSGFVADRQKPLYAIRPGAAGDISLQEGETQNRYVAWRQPQTAPYVPSFLVAGKYLYVIKDIGLLACYDAVTGASIYEERLRGHFTASPWMCGDRLFLLNERGDTCVVQAGPTFRLLATNTLEKLCLATPAVAGDHLLIRTSQEDCYAG